VVFKIPCGKKRLIEGTVTAKVLSFRKRREKEDRIIMRNPVSPRTECEV
jgi:hypothetical protein